MAKFLFAPLVNPTVESARVGTKAAPLKDEDAGKLLTLATGVGSGSRLELAGDGDEIFGALSSIESGTQDGFKIGGVVTDGYLNVDTTDCAVGDVVVVSSNPASGTKGKTIVKKATDATLIVQKWQVVEVGVIRKV